MCEHSAHRSCALFGFLIALVLRMAYLPHLQRTTHGAPLVFARPIARPKTVSLPITRAVRSFSHGGTGCIGMGVSLSSREVGAIEGLYPTPLLVTARAVASTATEEAILSQTLISPLPSAPAARAL